MATIVRTQEEIDKVLSKAMDNAWDSLYPGMSYEQGIELFWMWLIGETDENPFE